MGLSEWPARKSVVWLLLFFLSTSQATLAQLDEDKTPTKVDPARGLDLAERWCASCHIVSKRQTKGMDGVPSFASVAQRPDLNVGALAFFLLDPHPVMPNLSLSRDDARDLAAYIATQR